MPKKVYRFKSLLVSKLLGFKVLRFTAYPSDVVSELLVPTLILKNLFDGSSGFVGALLFQPFQIYGFSHF